MEVPVKPLGYWLKHIDRLVEDNFERLLGGDGITRRHWQILNTMPSTMAEIDDTLAPFQTGETFQPLVNDLVDKGWVQGAYQLTPQGAQAYERISAQVCAARRQAVDGISDEEYATLVTLLERIATNVTPAR